MRTDVQAVERCIDAVGMPETGSPLLSGWKVVDGIVDVTALVAGTAETMRILAGDKHVTIEAIVPSLPVMVTTDPVMLRQIILNLLNNAIQSTERGTITIALKVVGNTLEVVVTDTGTGLRPNCIVGPADAMERAGNAGSQVGAGLGPVLGVSRDLARLIGGSISMRSVHGRGAMFTLTLPLRSAERRGGLYAVD